MVDPQASNDELSERLRSVEEELRRCAERLRTQTAKVEAIQELGRALSATLNLDKLLEVVMHKVTELLGADRSTLFLIDESSGELWSKIAQADGGRGSVQEIRVPVGHGVAGWVARSGRTVNVKDAYKFPRFDPSFDQRSGYRTTSMLCEPLRNHRGKIIGVIQALNKREGYFTVEDELLLAALGNQAAVSIENSKLYLSIAAANIELLDAQQRLQRKMQELEVLRQIQEVLATELELQAGLERALSIAVEAIPSAAGSVVLADRQNMRLVFVSMQGAPVAGASVHTLRLERGEGIVGWVALSGEPVLSNDVQSDPRHAREVAERLGLTVNSVICAPLRAAKGSLGAVQLLNRDGYPGEYTADDLGLLTLIAGLLARSIEVQRAREEVERESRLAAVGRSLSAVMHDFGGPMTRVSLYAQELVDTPERSERAVLAKRILNEQRELQGQAQEVLDFAKGKITLLLSRVPIADLLVQFSQELASELRVHGVELKLEQHYQGPLRCDFSKLRRLVWNLARNAWQAMPNGGEFRITTRREGDWLHLQMADNGPGIAESIRDRVFDAFVTSGKADGTGLGLAIVRRIVEEHGGTISFHSAEGQGTCFDVRLPIQGPSAAAAESGEASQSRPTGASKEAARPGE